MRPDLKMKFSKRILMFQKWKPFLDGARRLCYNERGFSSWNGEELQTAGKKDFI
jgi:hypothetical protein